MSIYLLQTEPMADAVKSSNRDARTHLKITLTDRKEDDDEDEDQSGKKYDQRL